MASRANTIEKEENRAKRSLYDEALDCFRKEAAESHSSPKDLQLLADFLRERATPEQTKQTAEALQSDAGKKWGGRKVGDVEIPESWIANIMANIEIFVAAGDFVTKDAPETVGMAWYAVKLTLTAIHSNYDLYTFFGSGLSDISEIMIIVRHYDRLYDERSKPQWKPSPLVEKLFQDVIRAYADVLHFSFAVRRHLTAGALTRIKHGFKDFFGLSKAKFEEKLNAVATVKKKIIEESRGVFQDKTLTQLQGVSTVLAGIEGTVQHIRDFQQTQQKLHEDAMAKFDALLKGLDDIKASTKRKTQWDYAVQDFQTFQDALSPTQGSFKVLGDTIDAVYPGTCQWVFDKREYRQWGLAAGNAVLCITGPEGSGKSHVVASIANLITQNADADTALLYVTCGGSSSGFGNSQSHTADSICRTFLSQLYDLAVQGEDSVGLLEACNAVFKRAKVKALSIPNYMRTDNDGLPEFADGFSRITALVKKNVVLVLDGLGKNTLDDKDQVELARKLGALMAAVSDRAGIRLHALIGHSWSARLFDDVSLPPGSYVEYIDVQHHNRVDMELVLSDALKEVPGLSQAEQETAKAAILEKSRSRFLYVRDTAIPFMREPFQRPLSKRLEALPDGASDVYAKALSSMSPNYLALLRTALTWTLLSPEFPGYPHAREVMDAFQATYDYPSETEEGDDGDSGAGFPLTNRLELEQLRGAGEPFLSLVPEEDGTVWVLESDYSALSEYFLKSGADTLEEPDHDEQLCARCRSTRSLSRSLSIHPKSGHLQMALTCLRHLNNPLFQRRAGLAAVGLPEEGGLHAENSFDGTRKNDEGSTEPAHTESPPDAKEADTPITSRLAMDVLIEQAEEAYHTDESVDDEDVIKPQIYEQDAWEMMGRSDDEESDESPTRVRYEVQYWPWHMRQAEELWPAAEREGNGEWAALMTELDKLVFETPEVFSAWQTMYPDKKNDEKLFAVASGPHKPLHVAAYLGLCSWVGHLLDRGEEVNALSAGYSPLQAAACSGGPLDTMKLLLEKGADVNAENKAGRPTLHLWMIRGEITLEGTKLLLEHGADARATCSLMHYSVVQYFASRGEDPGVLEMLLAHGADINAVHPDDVTTIPPLHLLLVRKEVPLPLLKAFIEHNADTNAENAGSARALQIVVSTDGRLESLRIILQSQVLEIDDPDIQGTTAVHEAAFWGHTKCVEALLEHGADPDITDRVNRTALHSAARKGHVDVIRVLLRYAKQTNDLDHAGWTPLFCSCLSKEEDAALAILDALIKHELPLSEINKPTRSGRTVLRQAADHGFDKVVARLIQLASKRDDAASLAIDARDTKKGMTALHRAAMNGHAACVQALLAAGAAHSLPDAQSRSPLALAYEQWSIATKTTSYQDIISLLIAANPPAAASDPDLVAVCAANGSVRLLAQLGRLHAPLHRPDRFGWTPLDLARRFARTEAEAFLMQQAAWAELLPSRWERKFPGTTPVGAASVCEGDRDGGRKIRHTSGKRVCVSADRPLPAGLEGFYFEVTLLDASGEMGRGRENSSSNSTTECREMAIGFCTLGGAALEFPGWCAASDSMSSARSWGYHSHTGDVYSSAREEVDVVDRTVEETRYGVGDTVGCGVDLARGQIWFTKNGVRLDRVCEGVEGRLFPAVGLHEEVCFVTNFGREGDGEFRYKPEPELGREGVKGGAKDGAVVEVVLLGGKGEIEERAGVTVASQELVVGVD